MSFTILKNPEKVGKLKVGTSSATPADGEVIAEKVTADTADNDLGLVHENATGVRVATLSTSAFGFVGTHTNHTLKFMVNNDGKVAIDSSGNVAIKAGALPSTNQAISYGPSVQVGQAAALVGAAGANNLFLSANALYPDTGHWVLTNDGQAGQLFINHDGSFTFRQERSSGIANANISWDDALTISSTGLASFSSGINLGDDTLSNYKVSTWIPTLSKGSTSITSPNTASGRYVRIGKSLFVSFYYYKASADSTSGTDPWSIGGLPFTIVAGSSYQSIACGYIRINSTSYEYTSPYRWQVAWADGTKMELRGTERPTNNAGGNMEFSGFGVFEIA
jgi:hypothetical protein